MKDQYLTKEVIKNHAISFKALKDGFSSKEGPAGLPRLSKTTDVLAWLDQSDKVLRKLPGRDFSPLAYLVCQDSAVPPATEDFLNRKYYSEEHGSLVEEIVARKSHQGKYF